MNTKTISRHIIQLAYLRNNEVCKRESKKVMSNNINNRAVTVAIKSCERFTFCQYDVFCCSVENMDVLTVIHVTKEKRVYIRFNK